MRGVAQATSLSRRATCPSEWVRCPFFQHAQNFSAAFLPRPDKPTRLVAKRLGLRQPSAAFGIKHHPNLLTRKNSVQPQMNADKRRWRGLNAKDGQVQTQSPIRRARSGRTET